MDDLLKFLKSIAKNNNREWFEKNKPRYLQVKNQFEHFLVTLHKELLKFDDSLASLFIWHACTVGHVM